MQTRRDLLQAHRLMTQRAALALLQAEPDPPDRPLRRLNVGLICSVLVAVIVAAAFGVWGILAPGHAQGLTSPGTLIIDSQTGTSYIWCQHGKLCPVVNYASARLALGTSSPDQRTVSQASLAHYPRARSSASPGCRSRCPPRTCWPASPGRSACRPSVTRPPCSAIPRPPWSAASRSAASHRRGQRAAGVLRRPGLGAVGRAAADDPAGHAAEHANRAALPPGRRPGAGHLAQRLPQGPEFAPPRIAGFGRRCPVPGAGPPASGRSSPRPPRRAARRSTTSCGVTGWSRSRGPRRPC